MKSRSPVVGLLALQGDYQKHRHMLEKINVESHLVRTGDDFDRVDRLIIPGGESTVIVELLQRLELESKFREFIGRKPVWGTCAGMILLAAQVNDSSIKPYQVINISVDRNGYGRQFYSQTSSAIMEVNGYREKLDLVFIRAPRVTQMGDDVQVLLKWENDPVLLAQKNILVASFHPELTGSTFLHKYFACEFGN